MTCRKCPDPTTKYFCDTCYEKLAEQHILNHTDRKELKQQKKGVKVLERCVVCDKYKK